MSETKTLISAEPREWYQVFYRKDARVRRQLLTAYVPPFAPSIRGHAHVDEVLRRWAERVGPSQRTVASP